MAIDWNEAYTSGHDYSVMNVLLLEKILEAANTAGKSVLDLGCGTGDLSVKLAKRGYSVTAVDASNVAIAKANQRAADANVANKIDFRVMNIEDNDQTLQLNAVTYDLIFSKLVYAFMEHKNNVLEWVQSHLSNDGSFILITPVLYDGIAYTPRMRNISVPAEVLQSELNAHFGTISTLHTDYIDENGEVRTIIARTI